jgi:hypothetical protein
VGPTAMNSMIRKRPARRFARQPSQAARRQVAHEKAAYLGLCNKPATGHRQVESFGNALESHFQFPELLKVISTSLGVLKREYDGVGFYERCRKIVMCRV